MDNSVNGSKAAEFVIREAVAGDEAALLDLIRELAAYEEMAADVVASESVLRYWLFDHADLQNTRSILQIIKIFYDALTK